MKTITCTATRFAFCLSLVMVLGVLGEMGASAETGAPELEWNTGGVQTGVWQQVPGGGDWVIAPVTSPEDIRVYKFEMLCLIEENHFDPVCLAQTIQCAESKGGHPIQWFASLRIANPPVWVPFGVPRCVYAEKPKDALDLIAENIQKKFEESPIVAASVVSQPGPNTLLGAHTNFYATAAEQSFDVEMFGQKVHITATPVEYTWSYGDGVVVGPSPYAGGSLTQDRWGEPTNTSHQYGATGDFAATVTTHFRGTYSVNDGPRLPVANQGHFASAPLPVSVWRSVVKNYEDDCIVNPAGAGC